MSFVYEIKLFGGKKSDPSSEGWGNSRYSESERRERREQRDQDYQDQLDELNDRFNDHQ